MSLRTWSGRRILTLWVTGIAIQALLIVGSALLARQLVAGDRSRLERRAAALDARSHVGGAADSLSIATQHDQARAAGTYSITPKGDTLFARYFSYVFVGGIPMALIAITFAWLFARRGRNEPPQMLSAT
ncbi:MAG: hypothetical protein ABJE10_00475 [bacterium]